MRIAIIGDNETCRATRMLLRRAGFAVQETPARNSSVRIWIEERPQAPPHIYFDSVDSPLEAAVVRHVTQLSPNAVMIDRPGGSVHSDTELRIAVPEDDFAQQHAVQLGILRGLLDFAAVRKQVPRWKQFFGLA